MKKFMKVLPLSALVLIAGSSLTSCASSGDGPVLRIINSEDYIYLNDPKQGYDAPDMVDQFKAYVKKNYPQYKNLEVVYDTSDTNETLYSELQTGKTNYDLMNVSDYMAQKIVSANLAVPFYQHGLTIDNYENYASKDIKDRLDNIIATKKVKNPETGKYEDKEIPLKDYAVGYMWGTLGILFNPDYPGFKVEKEELINDMQSFDALWDTKYKGTISIKNSMRDTYALGLMHTFADEFEAIRSTYLDDGDLEKYQAEFAKIFNRCEEKDVAKVQKSLEELKNNIFGLEVDSGKQDIVTKKIGVNLAWSGDAVYSMDQAEDPAKVGKNTSEIYYSVPELGSNLWFDTWIMPNCQRSDAQYELAHIFLDFICDPVNANQNMEYTGYTSFIAGDSILELVRDWYDIRTDEIYEEDYQIYSVNAAHDKFTAIDYPDFLEGADGHDSSRDGELLYYFVPEGEKEEPEKFSDLEENIVYVLDDEDEPTDVQKTYGDLTIVNAADSELEEVDLQYFFSGTLDEYDIADAIFYSDCYLPFTYEDEDGNEIQNISVGRQFFCQYPNKDTLDRCGVMRDYGKNNTYVMKMWENFKSDPLPTWAIVTLSVFVAGIVGLIGYFVINKVLKKKTQKKYYEKN